MSEPRACRLLADSGRKIEAIAGEDGLTIRLKGGAPDKICSVMEMEYAGELRPGSLPSVVTQNAVVSTTLSVSEKRD